MRGLRTFLFIIMWSVSPSKTENYGINTLNNIIMKKLHLLKTVFLLCALVVGSMNGWANVKTSTLNFTAACGGTGTADDGIGWTITSDASESTFSSTDGIHYGTSSAQVKHITLTSAAFSNTYTITKVVVTTRDAQANAAITVKVGTTSFTTGNPASASATATNTSTPYEFTGSAAGAAIEVKVERASKQTKAIYVKSIVVTYDDGLSLIDPTISFENPTYKTIFGESFTAPTPTCNSDGAKSYVSSNTDVAEVNSNTGALTIKAKGTTTITLNVAASSTYSAGSASYDLIVQGGIEDGVFDFTAYQDYGSGAVPGTSANTTATTWTAENVTMSIAGRNVWYNSTSLRLYKANGTDAAGSVTFAAPAGYFITRIVFSGTRAGNLTANNGAMTGTTWAGKSNSVTLTHGGDDAIYLNTATVYYTNAETVSITMGEAGYMTYRYLNANLSFGDGVEAYVASAVGENVTLTKVSAAPAGTPLVLKATAGAHNLTIAESAAAVGTNNLKVSNGTSAKGDDVYVLAKPAGKSVGFYKWASATSLSAGKIYLKLPSSSARESLDINFEDDVTAIESVAETWKIDGQYFDLQGRKVSQPTKGLYIVNGKKVILK